VIKRADGSDAKNGSTETKNPKQARDGTGVQDIMRVSYNEKVFNFPATLCQPPTLSLSTKASLKRRRLAKVV
jgi:hypothetical protein